MESTQESSDTTSSETKSSQESECTNMPEEYESMLVTLSLEESCNTTIELSESGSISIELQESTSTQTESSIVEDMDMDMNADKMDVDTDVDVDIECYSFLTSFFYSELNYDKYSLGAEVTKKIYVGTEMTKLQTVLLILRLYIRHKMAYATIDSVLHMLHFMLPKPTLLPRSWYRMKQYISQYLPQVHHYCLFLFILIYLHYLHLFVVTVFVCLVNCRSYILNFVCILNEIFI